MLSESDRADNESGIMRAGGVGFQALLFNRLQQVNIFHKSVLHEGIRKLERPEAAGIGNEETTVRCEYYSHLTVVQENSFNIVCCQSKTPAAKGSETGLAFILVRVGEIGDKNLAAPQPLSWKPDLGEAETACLRKR